MTYPRYVPIHICITLNPLTEPINTADVACKVLSYFIYFLQLNARMIASKPTPATLNYIYLYTFYTHAFNKNIHMLMPENRTCLPLWYTYLLHVNLLNEFVYHFLFIVFNFILILWTMCFWLDIQMRNVYIEV